MHITVINKSTLVNATDFANMVAAVQYQLAHHAAGLWGRLYWKVDTNPGGAPVFLFDHADQAGALGYHDETPEGQVYGRVFVQPVLDSGGGACTGALTVSSVLSHEVLEMFGDPNVQLWADMGDGTQTAYELCDAVEGDSYTVMVNGVPVTVSNFLLPAWFDDNAPAGSRFDFLHNVRHPFAMTPGGYMIVRSKDGIASNVFGYSYQHKPGKGMVRTMRRS